jgi:hypothetical protein
MPPKMLMNISNGNYSQNQIRAYQNLVKPPAPKVSGALSAPMIGRIQFARAGCGSCGG